MNQNCAVYKVTNIFGKRWSILILLSIHKSKEKRYSDIKNELKMITPKMLSLRLKELEKEGLIKKEIDSTNIPIKCCYSLTNSGMDFIKIIKDMKKWALLWMKPNLLCTNQDCIDCSV